MAPILSGDARRPAGRVRPDRPPTQNCMTTASVIALAYFILLILLALWGLKWHRRMLRLIRERLALAEAEDKPKLVTIGLANTLRYHYRVLEAYATISINVLGVWLILAIPP